MNAGEMPTEQQCLARRLHECAETLRGELQHLADGTLALERDGDKPSVPASMVAAVLAENVRAMEFDARRLDGLVDDQTQSMREMFSKTMAMVDDLRAGAALAGGWSEDMNVSMQHVGDLQAMICAQFPGEESPGTV